MAEDRIHELLLTFFDGTLTSEEEEELALWIDTFQNKEEWQQQLREIWMNYEPNEVMEEERAEKILHTITKNNELSFARRKSLHLDRRILQLAVAAAVVGLLLAFSIKYLVGEKAAKKDVVVEKKIPAPIVPGGNKAILTLSNGKKMALDSLKNGLLANNGSSKVLKISGGVLKLRKEEKGSNVTGKVSYNTITTPRGGQYKVILPEGSKIWLNAGSSLRFPTEFGHQKREVYVKGEAFAKVTKDENRPFYVHILSASGEEKGKIKVLGTRFNINAYPENVHVKTALISGSIKVERGNKEKILTPGERAFIKDGKIAVKKEMNLDRVIAWKNGQFNFEGNDIRHVMQQIARWYDVKVKYEKMPTDHFVGTISRGKDISEVLNMLEMTGVVHFKVEGRTVVVGG